MRSLVFLLLFGYTVKAQDPGIPIGTWREHLPYNSTIDVTASTKKIYAATPWSLFTVDLESKELSRMSKVTGLTETGISTIRYDEYHDKLFIAYTNSNIDVIDKSRINNIPDLERENIAGDKSIYHIYPDADYCYLSTGLGVVLLHPSKYEISDTWQIGANGTRTKVSMFAKTPTHFYAATDEGLKRCAVNGSDPANFNNWQNLSGLNGLPSDTSRGVMYVGNKVIARKSDSLFVLSGNTWSLFYASDMPVISMEASEGKILLCQTRLNGQAKVTVLLPDGTVDRVITQPGIISFPSKAIIKDGVTWIADRYGALSEWTAGSFESYKPDSPEDIAMGEIVASGNSFFATAGSVNSAWNYQYNRSGVFEFSNGTWTNYNQFRFPVLDTLMDFITIAIDPRDGSIWAGSFGGGLLHIINGNAFQIFKQSSAIEEAVGDPGNYRVSGLAFDAHNNLWIANYGATQYLHVLKADNTWQSFTSPFTLGGNAAGQLLVDDYGQIWMISPKNNGLILFNHNNTIDNKNDDKWMHYRGQKGLGNLPSDDVLAIVKDKSGFIWVGTSDGIGVVQCAGDAFITGCEALIPVAKNGNFANYLFKGEQVRTIAVDGADRKWVGTRNGVWLISPDGDKVIERFTEENSPLLSNDIRGITVSPETGEVFIATEKGMISFRGTATAGAEKTTDILIYPNPVPPGFTGRIGIKGLKENSIVKITELNGQLVHQSVAMGGQAVWNGNDLKGNKVSSGVYLVFVIDKGRTERMAGKIVFIAR